MEEIYKVENVSIETLATMPDGGSSMQIVAILRSNTRQTYRWQRSMIVQPELAADLPSLLRMVAQFADFSLMQSPHAVTLLQ